MLRGEELNQGKMRMVGDVDVKDWGWKSEMDGAKVTNWLNSAIMGFLLL